MGIQKSLTQQIRKFLPGVFKVWAIYTIMFSLIIGSGKLLYNIPAGQFTRDPNQIVNLPFYIGAISNLGIIFWSASATLCIFSYVLLKRYRPESYFRLFMLHAGIITTILLLDDLYMWHEMMFPLYLKIPELVVYASYAMYFGFFLIKFRKVILETEYLILMAAFLFMGTSVLMDAMTQIKLFAKIIPAFYRHETLLEDFSKSLGILTWLIYFCNTTFTMVLPQVKDSAIG